jgi:hypothetical protein
MTAPFNPTELARKHAVLISRESSRAGTDGGCSGITEDDALSYLQDFARDLIAQSGALSTIEMLSGRHCYILSQVNGERYDGTPPSALDTIHAVGSTLVRLRSITEAERGGVES